MRVIFFRSPPRPAKMAFMCLGALLVLAVVRQLMLTAAPPADGLPSGKADALQGGEGPEQPPQQVQRPDGGGGGGGGAPPGEKRGLSEPVMVSSGRKGNFEPDESNKVAEDPVAPGENGAAYAPPESDRREEDRLKNVYGFNQLVSDRISLDRKIPDTRDKECQNWDYPTDLPTASVVLVFHNEGFSTLMRTVHSIINRSPPQFLHEIVLVDDKSELTHLHQHLEDEIRKPFYENKVRIVRNQEREGLIRSRNNGAIASNGEVVVFLDAHCEVGYNWLPPLLAPIHKDPKTLSVPVIDGIQWSDFSIHPVYGTGSLARGLFEWGMLYKEGDLPKKEKDKMKHKSEPYPSPTHAGGLFAIRRDWFEELGWYDPGLWVWGGENFELSFKVWMCGGNSVWVPCSKVAHVYRGHSCSSCHSGSLALKFQGQPTTLRNYKRVIETWFDDEYKEAFYTREPFARFVDMGDISAQLAVKERLKCSSFDWFMKEIAYDVLHKYPLLPPNQFWGELVGKGSNDCLDSLNRNPPEKIMISGCHHSGGNQLFRLNTKGQLTTGEWCVEAGKGSTLQLAYCTFGSVDGPWQYSEDNGGGRVYNSKVDQCLEANGNLAALRPCDSSSTKQQWKFKEVRPYWYKEGSGGH